MSRRKRKLKNMTLSYPINYRESKRFQKLKDKLNPNKDPAAIILWQQFLSS